MTEPGVKTDFIAAMESAATAIQAGPEEDLPGWRRAFMIGITAGFLSAITEQGEWGEDHAAMTAIHERGRQAVRDFRIEYPDASPTEVLMAGMTELEAAFAESKYAIELQVVRDALHFREVAEFTDEVAAYALEKAGL